MNMWSILRAHNQAALENTQKLVQSLTGTLVFSELHPYRERIVSICLRLQTMAEKNLGDIAEEREVIVEDILSSTQQVIRTIRLLSARMVAPILRVSTADRLSLWTIMWVHREHPRTGTVPGCLTSGDCSVWPFVHIAPIYYFPFLEQQSLLFQPLIFHEFGHVLYVVHGPELDALVGDLQGEIEDALVPPSQRNDRYSDTQALRRQTIVDTWYRWTQELFCDAVGLTIGGPAYLRAFSNYLATMERGAFFRDASDLGVSDHPVTWLRIHLLAGRARRIGFESLADEVISEWNQVADAMKVRQDYHGFYDPSLEQKVTRAIDDMLTEADPRECTESEAGGLGWESWSDSPVALFNKAWSKSREGSRNFELWQEETLQTLPDEFHGGSRGISSGTPSIPA